MAALTNPRRERMAQELVTGANASKAYENAGYKPSRAGASRLQHAPDIKQRVAELLAERARMARKASEKAVEALAIDRKWVLARLVQNAERALEAGDGSVANRALELLGIEQGMFIKRTESGAPGDFAALQSGAEIVEALRAEAGDDAADTLAQLIERGRAPDDPPVVDVVDLATVETANRSAT